MPTLEFDGKTHIQTHYLTVPHRSIDAVPEKSVAADPSVGRPDEENLIIHGDNLDALKALLPRYAGRVKCVYIDPPYNTGNEGWIYNDNVNSDLMRRWLEENGEVDGEDLERHEKWLCMMWPRLQLLRELLSDDGAIFISIDDNEQHRLRMMMDEIFGADNFIAQIVVQTNPRGRFLRRDIALTHEYVLTYAKHLESAEILMIPKSAEALSEYDASDDRGRYRLLRLRNTGVQFFNRETRPNLFYPIYVDPSTGETSLSRNDRFSIEVLPVTENGREGCWTWSRDKIRSNPGIVVGHQVRGGQWRIYRKDYLEGDSLLTRVKSIFLDKEINHEVGRETLTDLFSNVSADFPFPKSPHLIKNLIQLICKEGVVLDSFAGSGTTAHAVLALNKEDGGNRQFILVECQDYADSITAERVRRVIRGVPSAKDKALREGLGGSFTYCELGEPLSINGMLTGEALPSYESLARYLLYTASGVSEPGALQPQNEDGLFYQDEAEDYYLLYEPDVEYLRGKTARLNLERARRIHETGRKAVVFGIEKFLGQRVLTAMGITFCQLPYCISSRVD